MERVDIEKLCAILENLDIEPFQYPRYLGNGVYEVLEGVYGGRRLVEEIDEEICKMVQQI